MPHPFTEINLNLKNLTYSELPRRLIGVVDTCHMTTKKVPYWKNCGLVMPGNFRHVHASMKKSGCVIVLLFLALCASVFVNGLLLVSMGAKSGTANLTVNRPTSFEETEIHAGDGSSDKIVVIPLEGVIAFGVPGSLGDSMVEDLKQALRQASEDPTVKGVVMVVDSPGGEVTASDTIYHEIQKLAEQKPVVYYMQSIGASGAYYAACGANWIMCNETTFTGSIGVIISTLNYRELFGKVGLQSVVFKSGKFKDMLNGARELSPEESEYVQGLVMQSYAKFLGIVATSRGLNPEALKAGPADGRILSGADALQEKLVDQLGYVEDAYAKAQELAEAPDAAIVRYERSFSFARIFRMFGEASTTAPKVEIDLLRGTTELLPGRQYFLPPFFAP